MNFRTFLCCLLWTHFALGQSDCQPDFSFTPTAAPQQINWEQFPDFTLPFAIAYGGPDVTNSQPVPLRKGFSHMVAGNYVVPLAQRALIYYGVAYTSPAQPWQLYRSPWGNDLGAYQRKWGNDYNGFSDNSPTLTVDWFVFDIERQIKSNDSILLLKKLPATPESIRQLTDADFITTYKKDLQFLYYQPFKLFKDAGLTSPKVSGYNDAPILNTFTNIQNYTWEEWQISPALVNPNNLQFSNQTVGGDFYGAQTALMPSAYYYFDYPNPFAGEYLSYLLFQIEVNKARSDKPVYPFVWLRYAANASLKNTAIRPWMAEATAIFPFFSGADGLWLWDDPTTFNAGLNYSVYEHFVKGLYRLSQFKSFFSGNQKFVIEKTAHELNRTRSAVWRGIVQGNNILIAAHNPFAKSETEVINLPVSYGNWSRVISLTGYEVFLCAFDMSLLETEAASDNAVFSVSPNPVETQITIRINSKATAGTSLVIYTPEGRKIREEQLNLQAGENLFPLEISSDFPPLFYVTATINGQSYCRKVVRR